MDNILTSLFSWNFILFTLGLAAITFGLRRFVEVIILNNPKFPGSSHSKFWTDFFLPIAPVINGAILGWLMSQFPYPAGISSTSARVMFGLVAGLLSGLAYRIVKGLIKDKLDQLKQKKETKDEPVSQPEAK